MSITQASSSEFEAIWNDGEFILSRSLKANPSSPVLLVSAAMEQPALTTIARLKHAYELRNDLDAAWAARPVAIFNHNGQRALLIEDHGGEVLAPLVGKPWDVRLFLRIAIGITSAVRRMHQSGLVHKDIKPSNISVNLTTGRVWLSGFGLASRLPRERQSADPPESIAGTLAYMAPEQTGRMNRSIDSRSDLYSLGVTFYEVLTGELPFTASDAMGWIHAHVAREPVAPVERRNELPEAISKTILKLLAKDADDRYQTAAGLEADLISCLHKWESQGRIDPFRLGTCDVPERLVIAEKLYGREREVDTLLSAFDRVVTGSTPEFVLVSGYSGIGKSSVVNELHKALLPPRGIFASGKFDQFKRDIPYATVAHAFQGLIRYLLAKDDVELAGWREKLLHALDSNAGLLTDLIPELKLIIGSPPPVPELEPQQAQCRFQFVFRRFVGVFSRPEHPLALFLDDLQWLDPATLDLIEDLLTGSDVQHMMLIGAYRDNEVGAAHPLTHKLGVLRQAGVHMQEIRLAPLIKDDLRRLIADTLRCDRVRTAPLAELVHDKTAGNPFFVMQFLHALAEERLLRFDHDEACWSWDLDSIHAKAYTDNVVDLMVDKLARAPVETQEALKQLACLGNGAAIAMLSTVLATSEEEVHSTLSPAVCQELVERLGGQYRFIHDRVQEAAYSLIPENLRARAHLRIGRLLVAQTPPEKRDEAIFEIVNQLNRGAMLITQHEERDHLAEFNLIAAKRAKASIAYAAALTYLNAAAALLAEDCWEGLRELVFTLDLNRAECEFLTGQLTVADQRLAALSNRASTTIEQAMVACLHIQVCTTLDQTSGAVAIGLHYLRRVGIELSPHPKDEEVDREYGRIKSLLGGRTIEDLIDLPMMKDPASLATIDVLSKLRPTATLTDVNLVYLTGCIAVSLSIEGGNSDASCSAYVVLARIAGPRFGDYTAGFRFGQLAYDLVEQRGLRRFAASTYFCFAVFAVFWMKHVRACRDLLSRAFDAASRIGDLTYASYACVELNSALLFAGEPLAEVQGDAEHSLAYVEKAQFVPVVAIITTHLALVRMLRGLTLRFGSFDDGHFDEHRTEERLSGNMALSTAACWYRIRKLQARYIARDYAAAMDVVLKSQSLLGTASSFFEEAEYHFYAALTHAACHCDAAQVGERQMHRHALATHHKRLEVWAENCPENFENRAALVGAEIARIEDRIEDAERLYERAIRSARDSGFAQNEAVAYERASDFYRMRGFEQIADLYLRSARYGYQCWGAVGKVRQLDELYPQLSSQEPVAGSRPTIATPVRDLDLITVLKVSQAVSGEIDLEQLIDTLMRTTIEHAGADRGLLILPRDAQLWTQAEATTNGAFVTIHVREALISSSELPASVVQYAAHTKESVLLVDACAQNSFASDEYIRRGCARSVLCLPLVKQGRLIALLYLENKLATNAFTPARIAVLKVLVSVAASSLENSRLYREVKEREAKIRRLVDSNVVGVLVFDTDGRVVEANDAFLLMVAYGRDDLTSGQLRISTLTPPEWQGASDRAMVQLNTAGTCELFEKEYFRRDGSRVPVLVGGGAVDGVKTEYVAFVLDLTERKRAEEDREKLHHLQADLARINRVTTMGELAASLAHEIKQPIAASITNANTCLRWLLREVPDIEEAREAAKRTARAATRASETISRIRSLFQKDTSQRELVNVNEMIDEIVMLLRSEAIGHAVAVGTQLAPDLPCLAADRVQVQQVLMNLILNAIDAMKNVEHARELTLSSQRHGSDEVRLSVSDTGVGLPPASDQIFDAFFTTKADGTGMGLAISRSIVESHGGRLWATPNSVCGASFHFTLPTTPEAQE